MANTYKDIIIFPNRSSDTYNPNVSFRGANSGYNTTITLNINPDSNGMLSFEGSSGQLFSITNDLTGSIYSVNDISGIPSIEVLADGTINLSQYNGIANIGTQKSKVHIDALIVNTAVATANTIDLSTSNYFKYTLTGSTTFTFANAPSNSANAYSFTVMLTQDGTGSRTVTWANTIKWSGGSTPPATTTASANDIWQFITFDGGTTFWGSLSVKDGK